MEAEIKDARNELILWLMHPNELGYKPFKIKYTNQFVDEESTCFIFKYKATMFAPWLLGIVSQSGTFSDMKEYCADTELADAKHILEWLQDYWRKLAQQVIQRE